MIPDYQTCMLPLLKYADDNNEHKFQMQWIIFLMNSI